MATSHDRSPTGTGGFPILHSRTGVFQFRMDSEKIRSRRPFLSLGFGNQEANITKRTQTFGHGDDDDVVHTGPDGAAIHIAGGNIWGWIQAPS